MGKKSRMKREARAVAPTAAAVAVLAAPTQQQTVKELNRMLAEQAHVERYNREIERRNHLPIGHPENAHKIGMTFDPIESWLRTMLATGGEVEVMVGGPHAGVAIFKPNYTNEWYPIGEGMRAVHDTFDLISADRGIANDGKALLVLANKIDHDMPLEPSDIERALVAVEWMKDVVKPLTPAQFSDFSAIIQARAIVREQGLHDPNA